jgi:hypothetical protein
MKQVSLNLQPVIGSSTYSDNRGEIKGTTSAGCFNFQGRLNIEKRPEQFQYRFGRKIQPKDVCLFKKSRS